MTIPFSHLDGVNKIIHWSILAKDLRFMRTNYNRISLFKALRIGTWHNLSDESLASSLQRDIVFMYVCGFILNGNKPDATTLLRFRNKLAKQNLFDKLLTTVNTMLGSNSLKLSKGNHVATDAAFSTTSRRPK